MKLVELISRRAGLRNVGEVGQSLKTTDRRSSDDIPTGRCPGEQVPDLLDVIGSDAVLAVKLNPDTSPGPSAGMSPQDTKLGEGVHVRG